MFGTYYFHILVMAKDFHGFSNVAQHLAQIPTFISKGQRLTTLGGYS
jgi:hypothetical protein